jgi:menaquinone-dependent protoporphyrinogen oxidase
MPPVLVLYATTEGHTARVAARIADRLRERGHGVDLHRVVPGVSLPDLAPYRAVAVGASVHYGRHPRCLRALLRRHGESLAARHCAFFSVCLSASAHYREQFLRQCGWRPQHSATFAGALQYSKYGPFKRLLVTAFARVGGHDTDPSRDYDYTDWQAVDAFAAAFALGVR